MPPLKRPKSTVARMALSSNYYALKGQSLEKILAKTAALKVPEWPSYGNSRKVTRNPHFLKKCKRVDQENFFKNRPNSSPPVKSPKKL